jgi:hypothetical protein
LAVTRRVPLSAWHELAEHPCFSRGWRKSHAKVRRVIWEMWAKRSFLWRARGGSRIYFAALRPQMTHRVCAPARS